MFTYCGNNPITRNDTTGQLWELIAAGAVAAVISGVSNAISTACSGGSVKECLVAGLVGAAAGAVGFAVAALTAFSPLGSVAGRAAATLVCDLGTSLALNGEITSQDVTLAAVDVTMDVCLSPIGYYYNPVKEIVKQTAINSVIDGAIDVAETKLFYAPSTSISQSPQTQPSYCIPSSVNRSDYRRGGRTFKRVSV